MRTTLAAAAFTLSFLAFDHIATAQIEKPKDAPQPLSPEASAQRFQVAPGFQLQLVASEPLVREPSGVCWDEQGQLYVCELHGYNMEGQYDIEELNKTGKLDRVVRRIQAADRHKKAAEAETYGTIKRLHDDDGDGRMDRIDVWADRLPPCLGICPARGGLIAACQTEILYLADRDGDGHAETRETLFQGFTKGPLERSINCPQWGPDGWIYFGNGAGGGTITGKNLSQQVVLPRTDFRIRADGSAIEPVAGSTGTMGFAFTESGDRFVISTRTPGVFVAPLAWRYLARNPDVPTPSLEQAGTSDQRAWPTSEPHPWRKRRAEDPGFSKYYSDRYGVQESTPSGYFTSACSPLVYRDIALPGLKGHLLACEPAQNLVHRALIERSGVRLTLRRTPREQMSEFLTSSDPWFHAIALAHAPDGSLFITDFYREIIEDYSAIPRYLQQQYGLDAGREHGRIWRLTHTEIKPTPAADMSRLTAEQLAAEVASPHFWRRQTARRLLVERQWKEAAPLLSDTARSASEPFAVANSLQTLHELDTLSPADLAAALQHGDPSVRRKALQLSEPFFDDEPDLLTAAASLASDPEPMVRLQVALSMGESRSPKATGALIQLAQQRGDEPWMTTAILTSLPGRAGEMLVELLNDPRELGQARALIEPLATAAGNARNGRELSPLLCRIAELDDDRLQASCLRGLRSGLPESIQIELTSTAQESVKALAQSSRPAVSRQALPLIELLQMETPAERQMRLQRAARDLKNVQLTADLRRTAVYHLADDKDPKTTRLLLEALPTCTPPVREAILQAVFGRADRFSAILDAVESGQLPPSMLSSVRRATLLEAQDANVRNRSAALFQAIVVPKTEQFQEYVQALQQPRDISHGQTIFQTKCAACHRAHGIGHRVGPDLSAEFRRAEETIVRDVLAPAEKISAGYETFAIATQSGRVVSGLLAAESPTSITLRQAEGKEAIVLRKDVDQLRAMSVSLMPDDLVKTVTPRDLADAIAWLRRPPVALMLLDDNRQLVTALNEGAGTAEFVSDDQHVGRFSLRVTPPQRYSRRIPGWEFPIRERPGPGEYRFLRFAWKTENAHGIMLEIAADGNWPPAGEPVRRFHAGRNTTNWQSVEVAPAPPREWTVVTRDLWKEFGDFTLTGIAPTALGDAVLFDAMELLQTMPADERESSSAIPTPRASP